MTFQTDKYYVCVGEYILNEAQTKRKERNQFLEYMKMVEISDNRMRGRASITRPSYRWDDWDDYEEYYGDYYNTVIVPKFTIGKIYKCPIGGRLLDDSRNQIQISDENVSNFVFLDMRIDQPTKEFIQRAMTARGGGVRITVEPSHLMDFNTDAYKVINDISAFDLWFSVSADGIGFNYRSMARLEDNFSIRNAVYDIWKKCRVHSKQCCNIRCALHGKPSYMDYRKYANSTFIPWSSGRNNGWY